MSVDGREVREVSARAVAEICAGGDVATALANAAAQADALIADYTARKSLPSTRMPATP